MSILRISIYQKNLEERISPTTLKDLARLKSDFLLLPEYFYVDKSITDPRSLVDAQERVQNWLIDLSKSYKGSIIGGTLLRSEKGGSRLGIPILRDGKIVDWCDKHELDEMEKKIGSVGKNEGDDTFILGGVRFATLTYTDLIQKGMLEKLAEKKINLLFLLASLEASNSRSTRSHGKLSEKLLSIAEKYSLNIVLCCAVGKSFRFSKKLLGQSALVTPRGISWQVSAQEKDKAILKTVMLSYSPPLKQGA